MEMIHNDHSSYILSKNVRGVLFFYVYSRTPAAIDSEFTDFETALARCKYLSRLTKGWTHPTLRHVENQWRIYSNSGVAFVPLDKSSAALVAACPGAARQLEIEDSKPF